MNKKLCALAIAVMAGGAVTVGAQQKEEITITTAVSNLAFWAVWCAEQLRTLEQEVVRAKVVAAGGGSQCQSAVVGRSAQFCASSSEGLILAYAEGAPLIAVQSHNRNSSSRSACAKRSSIN